jgi:hypothetical protein
MDKEYKRGYKYAMSRLSQHYRSFHKSPEGDLIGYTQTGSKHILLRKEDLKLKKGFDGGVMKAHKEYLKHMPTKRHKPQRPKSMFGSIKPMRIW